MDYKNLDLPIRSPEGKPKVGLCLGGGGARGLVYVGIYEVFIENKIPIDIISGTSIGAIIGGFIASGFPPELIRLAMVKCGESNITSFKNFNYFHESLFKADAIENLLLTFFQHNTFESTKIPFGCIAVNLESRKKVEITCGLLREGIRASSSLPLIFPPVFLDDKYLIDGGVLDNVPAMLARKLGAEKLIIINQKNTVIRQQISGEIFRRHMQGEIKIPKIDNNDLLHKELSFFKSFKEKKEDLLFLIEIFFESLMIASHYTTEAIIRQAEPDLILEPLINIGVLDLDEKNINHAIEVGRKFALDNLDKIKAVINE